MTGYALRVFGDPVLKQPARVVEEIDGRLVAARPRHVRDDGRTPGRRPRRAAGRCAQAASSSTTCRGDGPRVVVNPEIVERDGRVAARKRGASRCRALASRSCAPSASPCGASTSTATRSSSRATSCSAACSCTRSTTSTASCCSTGSSPTSAARRCATMRTRELDAGGEPHAGARASGPRPCQTGRDARAPRLLRHAGRRGAAAARAPRRRPRRRARRHPARPPPRARAARPTPSPVKAAAAELGLPVRTPDAAREVVDEVARAAPSSASSSRSASCCPQALLDALPLGFVNVHFSLLPRWRGAAPVERAILAGDAETGVCLMATRGRARHRPGVRACRDRRSATTRPRASCVRALVALGTELLVETLPDDPDARARAAGG